MTYKYHAVNDKPLSLWMMDDTSPFQDYSGYSTAASVISGTPTTSVPLVAGAGYSTVFSSAVVAQFTSQVYKPGDEDKQFSIEAWVHLSPGTAGNMTIFSHQGFYDGLIINGKTVTFSTDYSTADDSTVSYTLPWNKKLHIVATHTSQENQLWINGTLVDAVDITEEQSLDTFAHSGTTFVAGQTTTSQKIATNGIAVYSYAMNESKIIEHYLAGNDVPVSPAVPSRFSGVSTKVDINKADTFLSQVFDEEDDWYRPQVDYSQAVWLGVFPLDFAEDTSIAGVQMDWTGENIIVEASLNDTSWVNVSRGTRISLIPNGFDPTDKDLMIRVTFADNAPSETSYLTELTVTGFRSLVPPAITNRTITASSAVSFRGGGNVFEFSEENGIYLAGGSLTITPDSSPGAVNARTVEVWVKRLTSATFGMGVSGTQYRNGIPTAAAPTIGEWTLLHIVTGSGITGNIVLSGDAIVGQVAIYEDALSATDIANIYAMYTGSKKITITANSLVTASVPPDSASISAHDWSITGAG